MYSCECAYFFICIQGGILMPIVFIVFSVIYKEDAASEKLMSCKISD